EYTDEAAAAKDRKTWEKVEHNVRIREMPPPNKPQPSAAERDAFTGWVAAQLTKVDCGLARDPGRPTIRRLNRAQDTNTVRDLVGIKSPAGEELPSDDVGYGFDNIGDVLSMPPILLEKYMAAAEKILDEAIVVDRPIKADKRQYRSQAMFSTL